MIVRAVKRACDGVAERTGGALCCSVAVASLRCFDLCGRIQILRFSRCGPRE